MLGITYRSTPLTRFDTIMFDPSSVACPLARQIKFQTKSISVRNLHASWDLLRPFHIPRIDPVANAGVCEGRPISLEFGFNLHLVRFQVCDNYAGAIVVEVHCPSDEVLYYFLLWC
jgi:hypothetical protein